MKETSNELKSASSKADLTNIKSPYIIKSILFDFMLKHKSLKIIKYNKKIQNKIDICILDYQEYSEILSPIEIEIIPKKNNYGKFINIEDEDKLFCHIFFNNKKKK